MRLRIVFIFFTTLDSVWCFCREESAIKADIIKNKLNYTHIDFSYNGSISDCGCEKKTCIRKCCEENYEYVDSLCVYKDNPTTFNVHQKTALIDDASIHREVITGGPSCPYHFYQLDPNNYSYDEFFLQKDGELWLPDGDLHFSLDQYCLESTGDYVWAFGCSPSVDEGNTAYTVGMMISIPFLLATFIVYALLPKKTIHGKSLMCYVASLLFGYMLLCILNIYFLERFWCITVALVCLYCFVASFFWMNTMSIDIWWTFTSARHFSGITKAAARKQFRLYNLYAWGVPVLLILTVTLLNTFTSETNWYNPKIGTGYCWIKNGITLLMYFYGPLAFIIVINLILFAITALKIKKLKKETAMLRSVRFQKHNEEERQRFNLYVKLSLAMGVNWIMEIVSWAVTWQVGSVPSSVWYLTDLCNALYGVIIFFIFACKKKIWNTLKTRKCCEEKYVLRDNICVYNDTHRLSFGVHQKDALVDGTSLQREVITGVPNCPNNFYRLDPGDYPEDEFFLQEDGQLWSPDGDNYISLDTYCLETTNENLWALVCVPVTVEHEKTINTAGMMVSMPFLLATFIAYALLPKKNIHAKSLMCYVSSLFLAYVFLCIINSEYLAKTLCIITGLACLYFFSVSFVWMNVMSIDIWWTFSGTRDFSGNTRYAARKQFMLYNLYAWGVPFVVVLIVGLLNTFSNATSWYNSNIGNGTCWIRGPIPQLIFFYAPLALIIIVNLTLFAITAFKIKKLQDETAILRSDKFTKHSEEEHQRFKLYIRLSLAMGVNWIMEIVSWAVDWQVGSVPRPVWYLTDFCNAMYGVIIFFIFAWKRKIWIILKNQYGCFKDATVSKNADPTVRRSSLRRSPTHSDSSTEWGRERSKSPLAAIIAEGRTEPQTGAEQQDIPQAQTPGWDPAYDRGATGAPWNSEPIVETASREEVPTDIGQAQSEQESQTDGKALVTMASSDDEHKSTEEGSVHGDENKKRKAKRSPRYAARASPVNISKWCKKQRGGNQSSPLTTSCKEEGDKSGPRERRIVNENKQSKEKEKEPSDSIKRMKDLIAKMVEFKTNNKSVHKQLKEGIDVLHNIIRKVGRENVRD
ncbi:hypothetical protein RN001_014712 [Aquatica leii]|uniref:G-protein coupled receptors family 2 profile 2 domain-containing protein n=1 Tax=Aquatica leii TaxID=1421715 RepID=A0AAN7SKQ1_9COLE|nr:hypothetical protein RN001_014712 [Aquatica leii]